MSHIPETYQPNSPGRRADSPWKYDRVEVRRVLEVEGLAEARLRFPPHVVLPIARLLGLTKKYRLADVWDPAWAPRLGTQSDASLGAEFGIAPVTVCVQRRKLGIPRYRPVPDQWKRARAELSTLSDIQLATTTFNELRKLTGARFLDIRQERQRRGLPFHRNRRQMTTLTDLRRACIDAMVARYPSVTLEAMGAVLGVSREAIRLWRAEQS